MEAGVDVAAADGFLEGREEVVVAVTVFVEGEVAALEGVLEDIQGELDLAILVFGGGEGGEFEGVVGGAEVAVAGLAEEGEGLRGQVDGKGEATCGIVEGGADAVFHFGGGEGVEFKNLEAGADGWVDGVEGIFGCGSDDGELAAFQEGEEEVLFVLVEAVDFIEEEDQATGEAGFFSDFLHTLFGVCCGIEGAENLASAAG